jgi:MarR family transcriptional regulator, transcriptional regulator for hemolysin
VLKDYRTEAFEDLNITQYFNVFYKDFQNFSEEKLEPYQVSNGLYLYLIFVNKRPGLTLNEISKSLEVDKAYTTRAIKKLIASGYLRKEMDEKDNRALHVYPTEKCKEVMKKMVNLFSEWGEIALKNFSKEEKDALTSLSHKIFTNIGEREWFHHVRKFT